MNTAQTFGDELPRAARCILAVILAISLIVPALPAETANADSSPTPACSLSWDDMKPHLEEGLGTPYVFGGSSTSGWDCSGYATWAFNTFSGTSYTHYTTSFESELAARGSFVMEGSHSDLRDERMEPGDIIFFYSEGVEDGPTHMGIIGERIDGIVMVYHAFTNSFSDIYGNSGTMLQGLDENPGSSLPGIWFMSSGHGKGNWSKFTVYRGVSSTGSVAISKSSSNNNVSDNNENYSLGGAVYGVYSSESDANANINSFGTMTTDENGYSQLDNLKAGSYYVKEISPAPGFAIDTTVYPASVEGGQVNTVTVLEKPQTNPMELWLSKNDKELGIAAPQGNATLAKARFAFSFYGGQYSSKEEADQASTTGIVKRTWTMQTDEKGCINLANVNDRFDVHDENGNVTETLPYFVEGDDFFFDSTGTIALPLGTIVIEEVEAPEGYSLDDSMQRVINIHPTGMEESVSQFSAPKINEQVIRGGVKVGKLDREDQQYLPLGSAILEGAIFSIVNDSTHAVMVNGGIYKPGQVVATIETNSDGIASTQLDELPFGTYTITETQAPEGYLLDSTSAAWVKTIQILEDGEVVDVTSQQDAVNDQVKRGDISLTKVDETTMERLSGIPFSLKSKTTGEEHVIVTDTNGMIDTSSSWIVHSASTNANDAILKNPESAVRDGVGTWFNGRTDLETPVDDSLGALPYDTYTLTELSCENNKGKTLVSFDVSIMRDKVTVDLGTIDDKPAPTIHTILQNGEGEHLAASSSIITLIDEVAYDSLTPGKTYTVSGALHLVEVSSSGEKSDAGLLTSASGESVTATTSFVPDTPRGSVNVEFTFDSSHLAGKSIVAFESLNQDGKLIAEHEDINDGDQTVSFPSIATTLVNENNSHEESAIEPCTLTDTVEYNGLIPHKAYQMSASLHLKNDDGTDGGIAKDSNGNEIRATQSFVPSSESGTVDVTFSFFAPELQGSTVVAFETLERNGVAYAAHSEISDESQTVFFPGIKTSAANSVDNGNEIPSIGTASIIDTVSYENLTAGITYRMHATAHAVRTSENGSIEDGGAIVDENGNEISANAIFTPDSPSGSIDVALMIPMESVNANKIVIFETCYQEDNKVAEHSDINDEGQTLDVCRISTTAHDEQTQTHEAYAATNTTLVDTIHFENLTPTTTYTVSGSIHVSTTDENGGVIDGGILKDSSGREITAEIEFTPSDPSGDINLSFEFDASELQGSTVVAFEELKKNGVVFATHANISDSSQSVVFPELKTTALDRSDGDHTVSESPLEQIVDRVEYSNLTPGHTYTITGTLMNKQTNKPVENEGQPITNEVKFTAMSPTGIVEVPFAIPTEGKAGNTLVIFEQSYDSNGNLVASHEDINDKDQSITVSSKLLEKASSPGENGSIFAKTGNFLLQNGWIVLIAVIVLLALGSLGIRSLTEYGNLRNKPKHKK